MLSLMAAQRWSSGRLLPQHGLPIDVSAAVWRRGRAVQPGKYHQQAEAVKPSSIISRTTLCIGTWAPIPSGNEATQPAASDSDFQSRVVQVSPYRPPLHCDATRKAT